MGKKRGLISNYSKFFPYKPFIIKQNGYNKKLALDKSSNFAHISGRDIKMIDLIKELKKVMEEKKFKGTTAAKFINCNHRQVYRWLKGDHIPTAISREAIKRGINRMKRL